MLRKILIIFIIMLASSIIALTLKTFDPRTVEAEKIEGIADISTKPSIVALATVMKSFRASLSSELLDAASYPLGHKEFYSWTNFPPAMGGDRGGIRFGRLSTEQLTLFYEVLDAFLSDDGYTKVSLITNYDHSETLLEHYALEDHHGTLDTLFDYSIADPHNRENMEAP